MITRLVSGESRVWLRTLVGYGTSQVILALGAFVRIPLLIGAVGVDGYGFVMMVTGLAVLASAVTDALAQSARVVIAENRHVAPSILRAYNRVAGNLMAVLTMGLALIAVVAHLQPGGNFLAWVALCLATCAVGVLGGPSRGYLEATGSTALANSLQASTTFIGLPLLAVALWAWPSVGTAVAVTGLGLAVPAIVAKTIASRRVRSSRTETMDRRDPRVATRNVVRRVWNMLVWSWANTLNYAFDTTIVGALLGPVAAGEYGIATRIMTLAMMLSLGLNPLITATVSRWRTHQVNQFSPRVVRLSVAMLALAMLATAVAIVIGQPLAWLLSEGELSPPQELFLALGGFAVLSGVTAPLMAVYAGAGVSTMRAGSSMIAALSNFAMSIALTHGLAIVYGPSLASTIALALLSVWFLCHWRWHPSKVLATY